MQASEKPSFSIATRRFEFEFLTQRVFRRTNSAGIFGIHFYIPPKWDFDPAM
jgi:hypothetical protein